jgi:hypothetical protein
VCFSLSGGDDGAHGNQTIMEDAFNGGNADWEITRYAGVGKLLHSIIFCWNQSKVTI